MAFDYYRRQSNPSADIPPAPPLPPQRLPSSDGKSSASFLDRFLYGAKARQQHQQQQQSSASTHAQELKSQLLFTHHFGHVSSQSASHRTGLKLRALDINESRTHVVLAGGKILKTVRVKQSSCTEDFNIRGAAVNYAWRRGSEASSRRHPNEAEDVSSIQRETFDIEDVAWSNGRYANHIATAASNGKIMLYDLERPGVEVGRLHEHYRQVHKVDFNPLEGPFLLSASQDGTVRLWDLRTFRHVMKCESRDTFPGRNDGVRHTKWSPTNSGHFALCTDNGTVQRWDIRHNRAPVLKISAHSDTCNSIDWHPDGRHLISAGRDQDIKVWDLQGDRKQKPAFQLRAPKPVQNVRWRPPCYVSDAHDNHTKQCTFFATSYRNLPVVHIWDLRRPFLPFRKLYHQINSGTTDMLWHSRDLLWTVGPEGEFTQSDVRYLPRTLDRRTMQTFSSAPNGELTFFSQKRPERHAVSSNYSDGDPTGTPSRSRAMSKSPEKHSGSLVAKSFQGDDSVDENFLSSSLPKKHSRASSFKSSPSLGSTPPSYEDFAKPVTQLQQTMSQKALTRHVQFAQYGTLSDSSTGPVFTILSGKFRLYALKPHASVEACIERIDTFLAQQDRHAQLGSKFHSAQTWSSLRTILLRHLPTAVDEHRRSLASFYGSVRSAYGPTNVDVKGGESAEKGGPEQRLAAISKHLELHHVESTSNVPTPIARPIPDAHGDQDIGQTPPLDLSAGVLDHSPESVNKKSDDSSSDGASLALQNITGTSELKVGSFMNKEEREGRKALISQWRQRPNSLLSFDAAPSQPQGTSIMPNFDRQDSGESFATFSTFPDSQAQASAHGSFVDAPAVGRRDQQGLAPSSFQSSKSMSSGNDGQQTSKGSFGSSPESFTIESERQSPELQFTSMNASPEIRKLAPEPRTEVNETAGRPLPAPALQPDPAEVASSLNTSESSMDYFESDGKLPRDRGSSESTNGAPARAGFTRPWSTSNDGETLNGQLDGALSLQITDSDRPLALQSLQDLLAHYSEVLDAQMAAHLFLAISPLLSKLSSVSHDTPSDTSSKTTLVAIFNQAQAVQDHIVQILPLSPRQAMTIVTACHGPLYDSGLDPLLIETLLTTYHEQLVALQLNIEAALLRRYAFPAFPAVYEQALKDTEAGIVCTRCRSPINNHRDQMTCESCRTRHDDCAICWSRVSPFAVQTPLLKKKKNKKQTAPEAPKDDPSEATAFPAWIDAVISSDAAPESSSGIATSKLWTACGVCSHATHLACAIVWFGDREAGGACPIQDCPCECAPGRYRDERIAQTNRNQRQSRRQSDAVSFVSFEEAASPIDRDSSTLSPPVPSLPRRRGLSAGNSDPVRRDEWEIGESRAVSRVVGALRDGGTGTTSDSEGGRGGRVRPGTRRNRSSETRRRVRVVLPESR